MKAILIGTLSILTGMAHSEEEVAAAAGDGRFKITQEYRGDYVETVRFNDSKLPPVRLSGFNWPGIYHISPDLRWLLRTQKTGSGDSQAMLYRVEGNGRVSEVMGFDELLWSISDATSRLKKKELYHTGVSSIVWEKDNKTLEIVLRGSNTSKSEDGIETRLAYDLEKHKAVIKPDNGGQSGSGDKPSN